MFTYLQICFPKEVILTHDAKKGSYKLEAFVCVSIYTSICDTVPPKQMD